MIDTYVDQLWENADAFSWLVRRGLTEDTIAERKLGFVGSPIAGHERFRGAIYIPYFDARGGDRSPRFRHLRPGMNRKYDTEREARLHVYGVELTREPTVYLTEGEFDAMILGQLGFPAAGLPGATSWQRAWRWLFRDSDLVVIVMDADEAGEKARNRIAGQLSQVVDVREVQLPNGMDVTELYLADADQLRSLL